MKLILGAPGSGKTKALLKLSEENNIPVLCENSARVIRLLEKADGYGFRIPTPVVKEDLNENIKEVYVDDVKILLETLLNVKLGAIVVNKDDDFGSIEVE